jgi:hypothetical protein
MIVWLASYPRSGNTLLRTILKQCMGYDSYDDQVDESLRAANSSSEAEQLFGHASVPDTWDQFYAAASSSELTSFVKTHLPPKDNQPAIYVVRDGRKALLSYLQFHRKFFPENNVNLQGLILGFDEYSSWSEHLETWLPFDRPNILLLKYEELINADMALLEKIACFIGYLGPIAEWQNPFKVMQQKIPKFYREGNAFWQDDVEWTEWINSVFSYCHGEMMIKLGYSTLEEISRMTGRLEPEMTELINLAHYSRKECIKYEKECKSRLEIINDLKSTCNDRLELIKTLNKECESRLEIINDLKSTCNDRLELIKTLNKECESRLEIINDLKSTCNDRLELIKTLKDHN